MGNHGVPITEIVCSHGERIKVSRERAEACRAHSYKWLVRYLNGKPVPSRSVVRELPDGRKMRTTESLSRLLFGTSPGFGVIWKNGDRLDYTDDNIEIVRVGLAQSQRGPSPTNASGYKGVTIDPATGKTSVRVTAHGRTHYFGRRDESPEDAARRYNREAERLQGEGAYQNPVGLNEGRGRVQGFNDRADREEIELE